MTSVIADWLVREAIDVVYPAGAGRRSVALKTILEAPRIAVPSPRELRRELEELRAGRM
jgi:hypothetical protein